MSAPPTAPQTTIANVASAAQPAGTGYGTALDVSGFAHIVIGVNLTTIGSGGAQFGVEQQGPDSNWYPIGAGSPYIQFNSGVTGYGALGFGRGSFTNGQSTAFTGTIRLRWTLPTGGATFSYWVVGQT